MAVGLAFAPSGVTVGDPPPPPGPDDVAGLVGWYKADDLSLANDDPVASWSDASGNGNHATQSTAGAKPTFKTGILNGKPVVRFDGSDGLLADGLAATFSGTDKPYTIIATASGDAWYWVAGSSISSTPYLLSGGHLHYKRDDASVEPTAGSGSGDASPHVFVTQSTGTTTTMTVDGTVIVNAATFDNGATTIDTFTIGAGRFGGSTLSAFWTGDMAEFIVYATALDSTDRRMIEAYLGDKFGITVV